jgi:hypothetical protein
MKNRQKFVEEWAPRVGERAANLSVSSARLVGIGGLLVPVWALLFIAGHQLLAAEILAGILAGADLALLVRGVVLMNRMYHELSMRFQRRVWFLNSPTLRENQFDSWCKRNGVEPRSGRLAESPEGE